MSIRVMNSVWDNAQTQCHSESLVLLALREYGTGAWQPTGSDCPFAPAQSPTTAIQHGRTGRAAMPGAPITLDNQRKRGIHVAMKWRELRRAMDEREHAYYADIIRRYPWPIAAIRAASPVVAPTLGAARLLADGAVVWDTIGWQRTSGGNLRS